MEKQNIVFGQVMDNVFANTFLFIFYGLAVWYTSYCDN